MDINDNTKTTPSQAEEKITFETDEKGIPVPSSLAGAVSCVLDRRNADDISVLKVGDVTSIADYFVICTAKSNTHVRALTDEVEFRLRGAGAVPDRIEGRGENNTWMVMDYGNVLVHIFTPEARGFYNLDKLYSDTPKQSIKSNSDGNA